MSEDVLSNRIRPFGQVMAPQARNLRINFIYIGSENVGLSSLCSE